MKTLNCVLVWGLLFLAGTNLWAIPPGFNIQGRLTDANGINKDATFSIKFSIFATATGGSPVWEQTQSVLVQNGNFQVILQGQDDISVQSVQLESAVKDLEVAYVEIKVGGEPPLVPRQPLLRSPFVSVDKFIGAVMFFAGTTCPPGWILANGANLPTSGIYADLFNYLQYSYGQVGANFALPNLVDGSFIRGTGGNSAALGVKQTDSIGNHTHTDGYFINYNDPGVAKGSNGYTRGVASTQQTSGMTPAGGPETRPLNYAMTPCVKY